MPSSARIGPALIHVAVVDDNTFYRDWLGQVGSLFAHHYVCARAATAEQLLAVLTTLPDRRCDVVLLDLRVVPRTVRDPRPDVDEEPEPVPIQGRDAVVLLLEAGRQAVADGQLERAPAVLVHTEVRESRVHVACLVSGAAGVVLKGDDLATLGEAIDTVAAGGLVIDDQMASLIELLVRRRQLDLTDTEAAVLALTAGGDPRYRIASKLGSSESTVDKHLRSIRDKFGDDLSLTDLADMFGLRDLARPSPASGQNRTRGLRALAQRIGKRGTSS